MLCHPLALIPYKRFREAAQSHDDYVKYIDELLRLKIQEVEKGQRAAEGMDLMGQLVRSRYEATKGSGKPLPGVLSLDEIRGNAFIMLVAGHETTANAVHFTLIHLAGNPSSQRRLHHELDRLVGDKEPDTWEYDEMINPLMASLLGAWMNETLRVLPPVIEMPKMVTPDRDQPLVVDSTRYVVPRGTIVSLCAASVHNNPRYWPTKPSRFSPGESDIHEHVPERWILSSEGGGGGGDDGSHGGRVRDRGEDEKKEKEVEVEGADREDYGGFQGRDTSAKLFRPESGAYIPFSFGARACLGRRIAQVEVIAALAVLLREYSVELAVDEWASDEEVARMDRYQKAEVYGRAQARMRKVVRGATSLLTLKLHGEVVPLRIVRRGEERFVNWMDGEGEQE
jgi:cytochrome P450